MIDLDPFPYKTEPYEHQRRAFLASRDAEAYALLMQMGTGKTKIIIDTAAHLYREGRIRGLFVVAPKGVHRKWIEEELPTHLPDWVRHRALAWSPKTTKAYQRQVADLLSPGDELKILSMNVEALRTKRANATAKTFLSAFPSVFAIDESHTIKRPGAERSKKAIQLGKLAPYRRILTGTPVANNPFDVWNQFRFLDETVLYWHSFQAFKHHYADIVQRLRPANQRGKIGKNGRAVPDYFEDVKRDAEGRPVYKNLDELRRRIKPVSFFAKKKDCLDLPEKVYMTRPVELTPEQRRIYDSIVAEDCATLNPHEYEDALLASVYDTGPKIRVDNALTKLIRLQQVVGGHFPDPDPQPIPNARIDALLDAIEETSGSVIVWCRFRPEIDDVVAALKKAYPDEKVVEYHGGVNDEHRKANREAFQAGRARFFVGTASAGGVGIDLYAASYVIYYTQSYSRIDRVQSEDRAHRIGQKNKVTYVTLIATGTVDEKVAEALALKEEIAEEITDASVDTPARTACRALS